MARVAGRLWMYMVKRTVAAMVILGVWLGTGSLGWGESPNAAAPQLKVAATIFPLYDLVRNVAGPAIEVVLLVPPGASPHTFAARPGTIRTLTGSVAIFAVGHGLDDWVTRLARGAGVSRTIVVDAQISLRSWERQVHGHGDTPGQQLTHETVDPHYWLAIPNAVRMVQNIADALGRLDPAAKKHYLRRAAAYRKQLHAVDYELRQMLAGLPRRDIATFHPAFGYFAEAYALQVVATFEPSPGREPVPRHVEQFLRQLRTRKLRVLFVEPQLPQAPVYGLARDLGVVLRELDPLGGVEGRDSYIAMMRFNASQIAAPQRE